jgi:Fatty acid hydroxylase superfamily
LLALILIASPVAGLRPILAARPHLEDAEADQPDFVAPLEVLRGERNQSPSTASACFFAMAWLSANSAARCLRVTVACATAFAGAALALAAAFSAAGAAFFAGGMNISLGRLATLQFAHLTWILARSPTSSPTGQSWWDVPSRTCELMVATAYKWHCSQVHQCVCDFRDAAPLQLSLGLTGASNPIQDVVIYRTD